MSRFIPCLGCTFSVVVVLAVTVAIVVQFSSKIFTHRLLSKAPLKQTLFKMKENELISDVFDRFITTVNKLKNLCKVYYNQENFKKLCICLPLS